MTEIEENKVWQIDEKLAKIIINKNFYFSNSDKDSDKESEFSKLPGHYQRAINREAAFQVKTLAQTEGFSDILNKDNMEEAQKLHDAICEYYAHKGNMEEKLHPNHPQNLFSVLRNRDADTITQNNFETVLKGSEAAIDPNLVESQEQAISRDKTTRRAKKFNEHIAERKAKGIKHDATATIEYIYDRINTQNNR